MFNSANFYLRKSVNNFISYSSLSFKMKVNYLPAWQDNYMYIISNENTKDCAVVDPVEPEKILQFVKQHALRLKYVLTTHHHADHASGNSKLVQLCNKEFGFSPIVYGGDDRVDAITHKVANGEEIESLGDLAIKCLHTPCHTSGHICYFLTQPGHCPSVFTGDTLFLSGCGRFFEGTADQMHEALLGKLAKLPGETQVYCGHEYTRKNLQFALSVEPNNVDIQNKIADLDKDPTKPSIPGSIADEMKVNPFMRVNEPNVQKYANSKDPISVMAFLRKQKDKF